MPNDPATERAAQLADTITRAQLEGGSDKNLPDPAMREIRNLARWLCGRRGVPAQDREDVCQEVLRQVVDPRVNRYRAERATAPGYVLGLTSNAIARASRRRREVCVESLPEPGPAQAAPSDLSRTEARLICGRLLEGEPDRLVRALETIFISGLSQAQTAESMGLAGSTLSRDLKNFYARAATEA